MKLLPRLLLAGMVFLALHAVAPPARAQTFQIDQTALLFNTNYPIGINWQSGNGVPISSVAGNPPGSDGLAPTVFEQQSNLLTTLEPTTNQFIGFLGGSYVPVPGGTNLLPGASFAANVGPNALNWPRGTTDGNSNSPTVVILRSALIGAPYFAQLVSYYFGAVIPPPNTDENGVALPPGENLSYWLQQPYTANNYSNAPYYWSPNARAVFASQSGGVDITWEKTVATNSAPADYAANPTNYLVVGGAYYRLYTVHYVVSGAAVKTPQKMFWTEGDYAQTGHPVEVPTAQVDAVNVIYNKDFPQFSPVGDTAEPVTNFQTLWFTGTVPLEIRADNLEGRVMVELLGEYNPDGVTRRFLGYEIVDVSKEPAPFDVTVNLGDPVTPDATGTNPLNLTPSPINNAGTDFYYTQQAANSSQTTLWATRETHDVNDFQVYWLTTGVAGLQWPTLFDRYHEVWPTNSSAYVNYLRPLVSTADQAALTAVQLPASEAPSIAYQDPLDQPRAFLNSSGLFYTWLGTNYPAHRTLVQFLSGNQVYYERVFSWLDLGIKSNALFAGSVVTNLDAWNTNAVDLSFNNLATAPYEFTANATVGDRIDPPTGVAGSTNDYWAGYIVQTNGNAFNPDAYLDPFIFGFDLANLGAIIPVNAIPGSNTLEVWWFRSDGGSPGLGFQASFWPAVIGHYSLQWPSGGPEIIMANNAGTQPPLNSLQSRGTIYRQPNPALPGYNPNEEHAIMFAGQAYALSDDLNVTNATGYTSDPYVLIDYTESDGRPAMSVFHVRREAPEEGFVFDYVVNAGTRLQGPMPLPLMALPIEGSGAYATNYDTAPPATTGDLPVTWQPSGLYSNYASFTFEDRQHSFWVYRGLHRGLPAFQAGSYDTNSGTFGPLPAATAVVGQQFDYYIHVSRLSESLTMSTVAGFPALPNGLSLVATTNGIAITGMPFETSANTYTLAIEDTGDGSIVTNTLVLNVISSGSIVAQGPLTINSTNQYSGGIDTYTGRPPFLAQPAGLSNSFTMRFYYETQPGFDWPGLTNPPPVGSIVPYLLPRNSTGSPTNKLIPSLDIVYRPVWPELAESQPLPVLAAGQTLTIPTGGTTLPAVRGQSSVQVLYQQSIATNPITGSNAIQSVVLFDPTVQKIASLPGHGLGALPQGVVTTFFEDKYYFQNLPPNLVQRLYYDPNTTNLVFLGQFVADTVGQSYLLLNVLRGNDLAAVLALCPTNDVNYNAWTNLVGSLSTPLYSFYEIPGVPGSYVANTNLTLTDYAGDLVNLTSAEQQVDSYALSATGPGSGYVTMIVGNSINPAHINEPVGMYVFRAAPPLFQGEVKTLLDPNPLSESISFQHTADLAGHSSDYQYDWRMAPPVDGLAPTTDPSTWTILTNGVDVTHLTLGGALGVQSLGDNWVSMRYRDINPAAEPAVTNWSDWTAPAFAPGYVSRVLSGINPFDQEATSLFNSPVDTVGSIIAEAGHRWEGDVALNSQTITNEGLIKIYETVLHQAENISIDAGYNYGPANSALLLVVGYLNDLYNDVANDAWANAQNPTISIGTDNTTYGDIATSLFTFQGQEPTLLEQNLALLRGRDDSLSPGVELSPVYNRLYWNYTEGINSGEVIYALNYDLQDENGDGVINAADAAILYPMGHGDAYGHYLTALTYYYSLLMNPNFDWVPQIETVSVLGAAVSVNYEDERKFAATAAAIARTGEQVFKLTWREGYQGGGTAGGWSEFGASSANTSRAYTNAGQTEYVTKEWGLDQWSARTGMGAYLHWTVGNAILPPVDPDPTHQGIQKVDRTTVPELTELPATFSLLQSDMDNAEAGFTPLNLSQNAIPFDINPLQVTGVNPMTHFEQIYQRALTALNNAVAAFNGAQNVTQEMRQSQNSLSDFQASVTAQELAYNDQLIELYGTPYPDDMGPGQTYPQGYTGPDLIHFTYVENPDTNTYGGILPDPTVAQTYYLDIQNLPTNWSTTMYDNFNFIEQTTAPGYYTNPAVTVPFNIGPNGFFDKPAGWTSQRGTVGSIQQAISTYIAALDSLRNDAANAQGDKLSLDKAMNAFAAQYQFLTNTTTLGNDNLDLSQDIANLQTAYNIENEWISYGEQVAQDVATTFSLSLPTTYIFGLANGGNAAQPALGTIYGIAILVKDLLAAGNASAFTSSQVLENGDQQQINANSQAIANAQLENNLQNSVLALGSQENALQGDLVTINSQLRTVSDAYAAYQSLVSQGNRIQAERLSFRQHAAAVVQGYRTSDAAFILFQNEDLQRYQTLFNLASEYAFLAAQAYDYETGLLNTQTGKSWLNQIISSQAIGVVTDGLPQPGAGDGGDPGLAGALAEMDADWQVLKGRLGFNNPDGDGTTVSLRSENFRILSGSAGDPNWQQVLQQRQVPDLLADPDVKRYCLQIDDGSGLPVPGIILTFSTVVADGLNLFGNPLSPGDHNFSSSTFATKIFSAGVDFDGYLGMDNPTAGGGTIPSTTATNANALAATPYVYLILTGADSMRSPPLGDASTIRTWNVDDVTIPLPYNIGGSDFSSQPFYTSADSLTEPLFAVRGNQAFRPVSSIDAFNTSIYGADGALQPSQFTNQRLIGRSIWNSQWKLVIPGRNLLQDPNQGLARFIATVKDVKLYFITYSYAGN